MREKNNAGSSYEVPDAVDTDSVDMDATPVPGVTQKAAADDQKPSCPGIEEPGRSPRLTADERLSRSVDCLPLGRILAQQGVISVSETATDEEIADAAQTFIYGPARRRLHLILRNQGLHGSEMSGTSSTILDEVIRRFPSQATNYGNNVFGFIQVVAKDKAARVRKERARVEYKGDLSEYVEPLKYGKPGSGARGNFFDPDDDAGTRYAKRELAALYLQSRRECVERLLKPETIQILEAYGQKGTRENNRRRFGLAAQRNVKAPALRQRISRARRKLHNCLVKKFRARGLDEALVDGFELFDLDELEENVT
jgi:hypothetical protein